MDKTKTNPEAEKRKILDPDNYLKSGLILVIKNQKVD
jgi:hypothetical protein